MRPSDVSAVIPTRGDQDLTEIIASLAECAEVIVWDNSVEEDLKVYGRYAAIARASMPVIYTQDDDCIIDVAKVVAAYKPGLLVANMPESRWPDYRDSALVGWGAVFDRDLPRRAFEQFESSIGMAVWMHPMTPEQRDVLYRTCDVIFSTLTDSAKIDVGFRHLPWAETPERMFKQQGHKEERDATLALAQKARR